MCKYLARKVLFFWLVREVLTFKFIRLIGNNTDHEKYDKFVAGGNWFSRGIEMEDWAKIAYKTVL